MSKPIHKVYITVVNRDGVQVCRQIEEMNFSYIAFLWMKMSGKINIGASYKGFTDENGK